MGHLIRPLAYRVHHVGDTIDKELEHIAQATLDEVKDFFYRHYAPTITVLAVTGNIGWGRNRAPCAEMVRPIPVEVSERACRRSRRPDRERRLRGASFPSTRSSGSACAARDDPDYYVFDILSDILSNGRSSRLNLRLVRERKLFSGIDAYISGSRDAGLLPHQRQALAGCFPRRSRGRRPCRTGIAPSRLVDEPELEKVKNN